ncbi:hypothetical protein EUX98_g9673 [Antrodiella citrinella]|uniref:Uncharacterized protein n=1 Tax=Antrodiella citrinella TaxID=2447956 RepID=A0A4S4LPK7_9APHY|nr:hypothetical protein EUX98_g9673 [Antrodiella citrinella]
MENANAAQGKRYWTYLQVSPKHCLPGFDVRRGLEHFDDLFLHVVKLFEHVDPSDLKLELIRLWDDISLLIMQLDDKWDHRLFCVLDEAQDAADLFPAAFDSDTEEDEKRAILDQIVRAIDVIFSVADTKHRYTLVISGTAMTAIRVRESIKSAIAKPKQLIDIHIVGDFMHRETHLRYLRQYLPPTFLDSEYGQELEALVVRWLKGRHRFTAAFLTFIIQKVDGFNQLHALLHDYVEMVTTISRPMRQEDVRGSVFDALLSG